MAACRRNVFLRRSKQTAQRIHLMPSSSTKCDPELLQHSLEDVLSEEQEERLATHLDNCVECRRQLEALAAKVEHWSCIENALRNEISGDFGTSAGSGATLISGHDSSRAITKLWAGELQSSDFAVDFLQPGPKPESLGQLNNIEIRAVIGRGGNGIVLKGFQEELNRLVAVKVMAPQLATSAAARQRFAREAQATAAIVHPNVMPILTVHSSGQLPYLVMPYVDCESLQERLDREGSLATLDILRIAHQVANGLAAAHAQGLVHRDVKPANILLEKGVDRVMLTDFGLARAVDDATLTRTGLIAGTPQYMSPEQARGESVDHRSDLFSLGSVMYAMCTGRPPFRAETCYGILRRVTDNQPRAIRELNPEFPAWLEGIVNKLLAKPVADRFTTAEDVASLLEDCVAHTQQPNTNALPIAAQSLARSTRRASPGFASVLHDTRWRFATASLLVLILCIFLWPSNDIAPHQPASNTSDATGDHLPAAVAESETESASGSPVSVTAWNDEILLELEQLNTEVDLLLQQTEDDLP